MVILFHFVLSQTLRKENLECSCNCSTSRKPQNFPRVTAKKVKTTVVGSRMTNMFDTQARLLQISLGKQGEKMATSIKSNSRKGSPKGKLHPQNKDHYSSENGSSNEVSYHGKESSHPSCKTFLDERFSKSLRKDYKKREWHKRSSSEDSRRHSQLEYRKKMDRDRSRKISYEPCNKDRSNPNMHEQSKTRDYVHSSRSRDSFSSSQHAAVRSRELEECVLDSRLTHENHIALKKKAERCHREHLSGSSVSDETQNLGNDGNKMNKGYRREENVSSEEKQQNEFGSGHRNVIQPAGHINSDNTSDTVRAKPVSHRKAIEAASAEESLLSQSLFGKRMKKRLQAEATEKLSFTNDSYKTPISNTAVSTHLSEHERNDHEELPVGNIEGENMIEKTTNSYFQTDIQKIPLSFASDDKTRKGNEKTCDQSCHKSEICQRNVVDEIHESNHNVVSGVSEEALETSLPKEKEHNRVFGLIGNNETGDIQVETALEKIQLSKSAIACCNKKNSSKKKSHENSIQQVLNSEISESCKAVGGTSTELSTLIINSKNQKITVSPQEMRTCSEAYKLDEDVNPISVDKNVSGTARKNEKPIQSEADPEFVSPLLDLQNTCHSSSRDRLSVLRNSASAKRNSIEIAEDLALSSSPPSAQDLDEGNIDAIRAGRTSDESPIYLAENRDDGDSTILRTEHTVGKNLTDLGKHFDQKNGSPLRKDNAANEKDDYVSQTGLADENLVDCSFSQDADIGIIHTDAASGVAETIVAKNNSPDIEVVYETADVEVLYENLMKRKSIARRAGSVTVKTEEDSLTDTSGVDGKSSREITVCMIPEVEKSLSTEYMKVILETLTFITPDEGSSDSEELDIENVSCEEESQNTTNINVGNNIRQEEKTYNADGDRSSGKILSNLNSEEDNVVGEGTGLELCSTDLADNHYEENGGGKEKTSERGTPEVEYNTLNVCHESLPLVSTDLESEKRTSSSKTPEAENECVDGRKYENVSCIQFETSHHDQCNSLRENLGKCRKVGPLSLPTEKDVVRDEEISIRDKGNNDHCRSLEDVRQLFEGSISKKLDASESCKTSTMSNSLRVSTLEKESENPHSDHVNITRVEKEMNLSNMSKETGARSSSANEKKEISISRNKYDEDLEMEGNVRNQGEVKDVIAVCNVPKPSRLPKIPKIKKKNELSPGELQHLQVEGQSPLVCRENLLRDKAEKDRSHINRECSSDSSESPLSPKIFHLQKNEVQHIGQNRRCHRDRQRSSSPSEVDDPVPSRTREASPKRISQRSRRSFEDRHSEREDNYVRGRRWRNSVINGSDNHMGSRRYDDKKSWDMIDDGHRGFTGKSRLQIRENRTTKPNKIDRVDSSEKNEWQYRNKEHLSKRSESYRCDSEKDEHGRKHHKSCRKASSPDECNNPSSVENGEGHNRNKITVKSNEKELPCIKNKDEQQNRGIKKSVSPPGKDGPQFSETMACDNRDRKQSEISRENQFSSSVKSVGWRRRDIKGSSASCSNECEGFSGKRELNTRDRKKRSLTSIESEHQESSTKDERFRSTRKQSLSPSRKPQSSSEENYLYNRAGRTLNRTKGSRRGSSDREDSHDTNKNRSLTPDRENCQISSYSQHLPARKRKGRFNEHLEKEKKYGRDKKRHRNSRSSRDDHHLSDRRNERRSYVGRSAKRRSSAQATLSKLFESDEELEDSYDQRYPHETYNEMSDSRRRSPRIRRKSENWRRYSPDIVERKSPPRMSQKQTTSKEPNAQNLGDKTKAMEGNVNVPLVDKRLLQNELNQPHNECGEESEKEEGEIDDDEEEADLGNKFSDEPPEPATCQPVLKIHKSYDKREGRNSGNTDCRLFESKADTKLRDRNENIPVVEQSKDKTKRESIGSGISEKSVTRFVGVEAINEKSGTLKEFNKGSSEAEGQNLQGSDQDRRNVIPSRKPISSDSNSKSLKDFLEENTTFYPSDLYQAKGLSFVSNANNSASSRASGSDDTIDMIVKTHNDNCSQDTLNSSDDSEMSLLHFIDIKRAKSPIGLKKILGQEEEEVNNSFRRKITRSNEIFPADDDSPISFRLSFDSEPENDLIASTDSSKCSDSLKKCSDTRMQQSLVEEEETTIKNSNVSDVSVVEFDLQLSNSRSFDEESDLHQDQGKENQDCLGVTQIPRLGMSKGSSPVFTSFGDEGHCKLTSGKSNGCQNERKNHGEIGGVTMKEAQTQLQDNVGTESQLGSTATDIKVNGADASDMPQMMIPDSRGNESDARICTFSSHQMKKESKAESMDITNDGQSEQTQVLSNTGYGEIVEMQASSQPSVSDASAAYHVTSLPGKCLTPQPLETEDEDSNSSDSGSSCSGCSRCGNDNSNSSSSNSDSSSDSETVVEESVAGTPCKASDDVDLFLPYESRETGANSLPLCQSKNNLIHFDKTTPVKSHHHSAHRTPKKTPHKTPCKKTHRTPSKSPKQFVSGEKKKTGMDLDKCMSLKISCNNIADNSRGRKETSNDDPKTLDVQIPSSFDDLEMPVAQVTSSITQVPMNVKDIGLSGTSDTVCSSEKVLPSKLNAGLKDKLVQSASLTLPESILSKSLAPKHKVQKVSVNHENSNSCASENLNVSKPVTPAKNVEVPMSLKKRKLSPLDPLEETHPEAKKLKATSQTVKEIRRDSSFTQDVNSSSKVIVSREKKSKKGFGDNVQIEIKRKKVRRQLTLSVSSSDSTRMMVSSVQSTSPQKSKLYPPKEATKTNTDTYKKGHFQNVCVEFEDKKVVRRSPRKK